LSTKATSPGTPDSADPRRGQLIEDRYLLEAPLGDGGMGVVYQAVHVALQKRVAVKILRTHPSGQEQAAQRFEREAQATARIDHPNVCATTDFGRTASGELYLVMEWLQGRTLSDCIDEGPMPVARSLQIAAQICAALDKAHQLGIVHRDIKPDNIMLVARDGELDFVKVLDFGIARMVGEQGGKITQEGTVFGTPQYLSPEQAMGGVADARADLYALGLVLFEMLTGRPVFESDYPATLARMHVLRQPPLLRTHCPEAPLAVERLIARLLQKSPTRRFGSAKEVADEIARILHPDDEANPRSHAPILTPPPGADGLEGARDLAQVEPELLALIPSDVAARWSAIPVAWEGERLVVAHDGSQNEEVRQALSFLTGYEIELWQTDPLTLQALIEQRNDLGSGVWSLSQSQKDSGLAPPPAAMATPAPTAPATPARSAQPFPWRLLIAAIFVFALAALLAMASC